MAWSPGRSKFARIADLVGWGFNAPAYHEAKSGIEIASIMSTMGWNRASVRFPGFGVGERAPLLINKSTTEILLYSSIIRDYAPVMICQGIPIADYWSGCVEVWPDGFFTLEAVAGRPVRDLTHCRAAVDLKVASNLFSDRWRFHPEHLIVQAIEEIRWGPVGHMIYEFSIFSKPLGCKSEHVLFWEYEVLDGLEKCDYRFQSASCWGDFSGNFFKTERAGRRIRRYRRNATGSVGCQ
ncbi:MAG: hypothetical protein ACXABY_07720 [Candidatus Thorarchaeota archaeon]